MKISKITIFLKKRKIYKKAERIYFIEHNDIILKNIKVFSHSLHTKTYKLLRAFKTSQYNDFYLMKNKKGFNTIFFNIHYDIIIMDKNGKVLDLYLDLQNGYTSKYYSQSYNILFSPVGTIKFYRIKINDKLNFISEWTQML